MDAAIIVLSSLVGSAAIVQAVNIGQPARSLWFLVMAAIGIVIQFRMMSESKVDRERAASREDDGRATK